MPRSTILILNPRPDSPRITSHKRALSAIRRGVADWVVRGVSMRLVPPEARALPLRQRPLVHGPELPAPIWSECWRTAEAAVIQPYQPYQEGV